MIILVNVFSAVLVLTRPRGLVPGMGCASISLFTQFNRYLRRVCCVSGIAQHLGMANTVQNGSSLSLSSPSSVGKCRKKYTIQHKAVGVCVSEASEAQSGASVGRGACVQHRCVSTHGAAGKASLRSKAVFKRPNYCPGRAEFLDSWELYA